MLQSSIQQLEVEWKRRLIFYWIKFYELKFPVQIMMCCDSGWIPTHRTDSVENLINFGPHLHLWAQLLSDSGCALYTQVSQSPCFSFCLLINRKTVAMDVSPKICYWETEG